ncbi:carbohydrate ABC transporter substrate-binding protein [Rahnella sp. C60]|uniref:ABC transporter substrate-binding protein n=2 Tax=Rahnella perminowiae TaxID=2816244 RepID=UPI001C27BC7E|nr:ABC transporter substrate-binding protein [Rahnella perminowiae]MBU9814302.1 carbohydrate ABC transporter substrate-binding protein [Rahnella perminowiae]
MKKMKLAVIAGITLFLSGCGPEEKDQTSIKMWIAPNITQEMYWGEVVNEWNSNPAHRKVEFTPIPAAGSSEEAIMNALASGTEPDISTNIFIGFAKQLSELKQLSDYGKMPGFQELVETRHMGKAVASWQFEGQQNVIPIYISPIVYWWRSDLLAAQGFDHVPTTYDEVYTLSEQMTKNQKGYSLQITSGKNWWDRWFDFIPLYYAASQGSPYIQDHKASFDNEAGRQTLTFLNKMFANKWTSYDFSAADDPLATGAVLGAVRGPWDIDRYQKQFPDVLKTIRIGPMLTLTGKPGVSTMADSKGIVMFSTSKVQADAWKFIQWVYSDPKHDRRWLELTGMPPAREDLQSNAIFEEYLQQHVLVNAIASYLPKAVPPAPITKTVEVQRTMTQMIEKLVFKGSLIPRVIQESSQEIDKTLGQ